MMALNRLGKDLGFSVALMIFITILYWILLRRLALINTYFKDYWTFIYVSALIMLFFVTLRYKPSKSPVFSSFFAGFKAFGFMITSVVNFILLLFVYIFGIGPVSIIGKIAGKRFLDLKKSGKDSAWHKVKIGKREMDEYYRQF